MFEVCYIVRMVLCALSVKEVIFIAQGVCFIVSVLGPCILAIIITGTQKHTDHNNRYSVLFLSTLKGCKYT